MSRQFLVELERLKRSVLVMGGQAEAATAAAVRAFLDRDAEAATCVISGDRELNRLELRIEEECLKLLSLYAPAAKDLRFVVGVFQITNDLERVGDLAVNIAERAQHTTEGEPRTGIAGLSEMAAGVQGMLHAALDAFLSKNAPRAREVLEADDRIDALLEEFYQHQAAVVAADGSLFKPALRELATAKYLERIADHASNIAEDVITMATGEVVRHQQ